MRDSAGEAEKIAKRWGLDFSGDIISFTAADFNDFYDRLIRITYFTPLIQKIIPAALIMFNLFGRLGLSIIRHKRRSKIKQLIKTD